MLGPLLFILFIDDIKDKLSSTGGLFADDCVIYREVSHKRDADELQRFGEDFRMDEELAIVIEYKEMQSDGNNEQENNSGFSSFKYCLNGINLEWVDSFRYLGVIV